MTSDVSTLPQNFFLFKVCIMKTFGLKKYTSLRSRTEVSTSFWSLLPKCPPCTGHPVPRFKSGLKTPIRIAKGQSVHSEVTPVVPLVIRPKEMRRRRKKKTNHFFLFNNFVFELIISEGIDSHHLPQTKTLVPLEIL